MEHGARLVVLVMTTGTVKRIRPVEQVLADLRDATRSYHIAQSLVADSQRELEGRRAHLANVAKYRVHLRAELGASVDAEVGL